MVQSLPRYIVGWTPRVNGGSPGNPSLPAGSQPFRSSSAYSRSIGRFTTVSNLSLDRQVGDGRELLLPFRLLPEGVAQRVLLPVPPGARGHRRGPASIFRFHFSPLSGSPWRSPTAGSRTCLRRSR